mmetsp:Transcript_11137/g.25366  ORF Transcript_11137/g.25366 Transcript_11137/m.25366 type:complete len:229 (-) Transcript_11137:163-849(-)
MISAHDALPACASSSSSAWTWRSSRSAATWSPARSLVSTERASEFLPTLCRKRGVSRKNSNPTAVTAPRKTWTPRDQRQPLGACWSKWFSTDAATMATQMLLWYMPTMAPRVLAGATSEMYAGPAQEVTPTPTPAMRRPTIRTTALVATVCTSPPMANKTEPMMRAGRRPQRSTSMCPQSTAETAAPTLKPFTVSPFWNAARASSCSGQCIMPRKPSMVNTSLTTPLS